MGIESDEIRQLVGIRFQIVEAVLDIAVGGGMLRAERPLLRVVADRLSLRWDPSAPT